MIPLPFPHSALGVDHPDQVFQSLALGCQYAPAEPREAVIATPRVVLRGCGPRGGFFDEIIIDQPL
jgi:hypothetical protein